MIVYQSTKQGFRDDVFSNEIDKKILEAYKIHLGRSTSANETLSWKNSMSYMDRIMEDPDIPADAGISIEFQIPLTSKRIDFIITGLNEVQQEQVVIIELKQWSSAELTDKDALVKTRFQHGISETAHPSYQAWSYATLIKDYNQTVRDEQITLTPCAYLHNYPKDQIITNPRYEPYITEAPPFFQSDAGKLREFIKKYVKYGDSKDILYKIENGRLRPSKQLADNLVSMLKGNQEFIMLDDQKVVYETALSMIRKASADKKQVLIVKGGPGTGKSVVAINLLVETTRNRLVSRYVSKNAAPRAVYAAKLAGTLRKNQIYNMFGGSGTFYNTPANTFDVLIVDEAHRLNQKSGLFQNQGEDQVREIIGAAKCVIFFVDDHQRVHIKDIGDSAYIEKTARSCHASIKKLELSSQFRCNGSDGYLAWLDNTLQINDTQVYIDGKAIENPEEMQLNYFVQTTGPYIPEEMFRELGISNDDQILMTDDFNYEEGLMQMGLDRRDAQGRLTPVYHLPLTQKMYDTLAGNKKLVSRIVMEPENLSGQMYPQNLYTKWTRDNYGPVWIPEKGATITLNKDNLPIYERCIVAYEGNTLEQKPDGIYINGQKTDTYTFKLDYYWMMGDNRHNSLDSRYWGFVPEDHVVGKPIVVWLSLDKDRGWFDGKIRWNRIFKWVH